jgi:hypothetical protein
MAVGEACCVRLLSPLHPTNDPRLEAGTMRVELARHLHPAHLEQNCQLHRLLLSRGSVYIPGEPSI